MKGNLIRFPTISYLPLKTLSSISVEFYASADLLHTNTLHDMTISEVYETLTPFQ